jgi:hypothetical protein
MGFMSPIHVGLITRDRLGKSGPSGLPMLAIEMDSGRKSQYGGKAQNKADRVGNGSASKVRQVEQSRHNLLEGRHQTGSPQDSRSSR